MVIKLKRGPKAEQIEGRRLDILELVGQGEMTGKKAEALAEEEGLGPFASRPDPSRFDVMSEVSWPIEMVLAWIIWRDPMEVTLFFGSYRLRWSDWEKVPRSAIRPFGKQLPPPSYLLETKKPAIYDDVARAFSISQGLKEGLHLVTLNEAKKDLWRRLEMGDLTAHGRNLGTGQLEKIEAFCWAELKIDSKSKEPGCVGFNPSFSGVRCVVAEVVKVWPATKDGNRAPAVRGRKPKYDWASFQAEAMRILDHEGAFNPALDIGWNQSALEQRMADWCGSAWGAGHIPGESTIRDQVRAAYRLFIDSRGQ